MRSTAVLALALLALCAPPASARWRLASAWLRGTAHPVVVEGLYLFSDVHTAESPEMEYLRGCADGADVRYDFEELDAFEVLAWEDRRRARVRFTLLDGAIADADGVLLDPLGGIWGSRADDFRASGSDLVRVDFEPFDARPPLEVPARAAADAPGSPLRTRTRATDGAVMVFVPAGPFVMGHEEPGPPAVEYEDARPAHLVRLPAFWIDRTEVTRAQLALFEASRGRAPHAPARSDATLPATGVEWEEAAAYCAWAGARLPTEAEWEKAARGGTSSASLVEPREYPWGDVRPGAGGRWRANVRTLRDAEDGHAGLAPVGSFPLGAGPYGTLDQAGNAWEWVADWYDPSGYWASPSVSPKGPRTGEDRVLRGGSCNEREDYVRSWLRHASSRNADLSTVGFRCASD